MKPDQIAQLIMGAFAVVLLLAGLCFGVAWLAALGIAFLAAVCLAVIVDAAMALLDPAAKRRRR